jgi:hypothetical protein
VYSVPNPNSKTKQGILPGAEEDSLDSGLVRPLGDTGGRRPRLQRRAPRAAARARARARARGLWSFLRAREGVGNTEAFLFFSWFFLLKS